MLAPGEKRNVTVSINVPQAAQPGGQYEAIFFSGASKSAENSGVGIHSRIGALLLFTVKGGDDKPHLRLVDWHMLGGGIGDSLSGQIQLTLHNDGITHVTPSGAIIARNIFGLKSLSTVLNAEKSHVLPASNRTLVVGLGKNNNASANGQGFVVGLIAELTNPGLGRYTLTMEQVDGLSGAPAQLVIWIFPWHFGLLFAISAVGLWLGLRWYRARLVRVWRGADTQK